MGQKHQHPSAEINRCTKPIKHLNGKKRGREIERVPGEKAAIVEDIGEKGEVGGARGGDEEGIGGKGES